MTPEEWVDSIYNWKETALRTEVIDCVRAAVEEEREACAQIVEHNCFKEPGEVADLIRERCTSLASACNTCATEK